MVSVRVNPVTIAARRRELVLLWREGERERGKDGGCFLSFFLSFFLNHTSPHTLHCSVHTTQQCLSPMFGETALLDRHVGELTIRSTSLRINNNNKQNNQSAVEAAALHGWNVSRKTNTNCSVTHCSSNSNTTTTTTTTEELGVFLVSNDVSLPGLLLVKRLLECCRSDGNNSSFHTACLSLLLSWKHAYFSLSNFHAR